MDNIIDRLAIDLIAAKAQRDKISEVIANIENSIVSQLGAKEEGSTTFKGDKYTVTTTGKFWAPTGAVTLQLDSFDDAGISGSMSFDAADSTGATITVAVTFDLDNPITG